VPEVTPTPEATAAPGGTVYVVKKNDTLWGIAQKYKITVKALQAANPSVKDPTKLRIGQKLIIPVP
jgi:LysM repeat protein